MWPSENFGPPRKMERCRTSSVIRLIRQIEHCEEVRLVRRKEHLRRSLSNIFGNPTNLAIRALSNHAQNSFGNTTYIANRTLSKKSISGNPTNSTKRTSSVTFGNLRENPSDSKKSSILPKKIIFGYSANSANETSLATSERIEECRTSSEIHYFGKTSSVEACAEYLRKSE